MRESPSLQTSDFVVRKAMPQLADLMLELDDEVVIELASLASAATGRHA